MVPWLSTCAAVLSETNTISVIGEELPTTEKWIVCPLKSVPRALCLSVVRNGVHSSGELVTELCAASRIHRREEIPPPPLNSSSPRLLHGIFSKSSVEQHARRLNFRLFRLCSIDKIAHVHTWSAVEVAALDKDTPVPAINVAQSAGTRLGETPRGR